MRRRTAVSLAVSSAVAAGVATAVLPSTADPHPSPGSVTRLGAVLVGGTEVPGPGDADGYGFANVRVSGSEVCWRITVNAVAPIAAAHIHAGPRGVSGPVVVPLAPVERGCAEIPMRRARFIRAHADQFYVNVHNGEFPAGALRGQLATNH